MQLHANHDWPKRSAAILERGVEVNAAAADGTTALHLAAAAGFRESCRVLLQHGADAFCPPGKRVTNVRHNVYVLSQHIGILGRKPSAQWSQ